MKINFFGSDTDNPRLRGFKPTMTALIKQISNDFGVTFNNTYDYILLTSEGNKIFTQYAKKMFDLDVTFWSWAGVDREIARGIDIAETPALTKFLLEQGG